MVALAVAALVVSFFAMARPALAATAIPLHEAHQGINSATADNFEESDCGPYGNVGNGVVWHFILNQLDAGTAAGELTATFTDAGDVTVTAANSGQTQHFWVLTPGDDILEDATATVGDQSDTDANLVLSHICHQEGGESESQSQSQSQSQSVEQSVSASQSASQSAEQSVEGNTGTPEQSVLAETGTPAASIGSGAISSESGATAIPAIAFAVLMLISLGGLAAVNLAAVRRNR
jgi:hypothetical protein